MELLNTLKGLFGNFQEQMRNDFGAQLSSFKGEIENKLGDVERDMGSLRGLVRDTAEDSQEREKEMEEEEDPVIRGTIFPFLEFEGSWPEFEIPHGEMGSEDWVKLLRRELVMAENLGEYQGEVITVVEGLSMNFDFILSMDEDIVVKAYGQIGGQIRELVEQHEVVSSEIHGEGKDEVDEPEISPEVLELLEEVPMSKRKNATTELREKRRETTFFLGNEYSSEEKGRDPKIEKRNDRDSVGKKREGGNTPASGGIVIGKYDMGYPHLDYPPNLKKFYNEFRSLFDDTSLQYYDYIMQIAKGPNKVKDTRKRKYDGDKKLHVMEWIRRMLSEAVGEGYTEAQTYYYIVKNLDFKVYSVILQNLENKGVVGIQKGMLFILLRALRRRYGLKPHNLANTDFAAIKMGKSTINEYTDKKYKYHLNNLPAMPREKFLESYIEGLSDVYRHWVFENGYEKTDWDTLQEKLLSKEFSSENEVTSLTKVEKLEQQVAELQKLVTGKKKGGGSGGGNSGGRGSNTNSNSSSKKTPYTRMEPEVFSYHCAHGLCFNCHLSGHRSPKCPNKGARTENDARLARLLETIETTSTRALTERIRRLEAGSAGSASSGASGMVEGPGNG